MLIAPSVPSGLQICFHFVDVKHRLWATVSWVKLRNSVTVGLQVAPCKVEDSPVRVALRFCSILGLVAFVGNLLGLGLAYQHQNLHELEI